jgi:hypothetical protein
MAVPVLISLAVVAVGWQEVHVEENPAAIRDLEPAQPLLGLPPWT